MWRSFETNLTSMMLQKKNTLDKGLIFAIKGKLSLSTHEGIRMR